MHLSGIVQETSHILKSRPLLPTHMFAVLPAPTAARTLPTTLTIPVPALPRRSMPSLPYSSLSATTRQAGLFGVAGYWTALCLRLCAHCWHQPLSYPDSQPLSVPLSTLRHGMTTAEMTGGTNGANTAGVPAACLPPVHSPLVTSALPCTSHNRRLCGHTNLLCLFPPEIQQCYQKVH